MSLSMDGAGQSVACDDLETQTIRVSAVLPTGSVTGSSSDIVNDLDDFEIAGGLDRDEVAELVAAHYQFYVSVDGGSNAGDSGVWHGQYELSTDSDAETLDSIVDNFEVADVNGTDFDLRASAESNSPDILATGQAKTEAMFEDETNGGGGGGGTAHQDEFVNYREIGESGPTFDRHNDLHVHLRVGNRNIDDIGVNAVIGATLYWNVYEDC